MLIKTQSDEAMGRFCEVLVNYDEVANLIVYEIRSPELDGYVVFADTGEGHIFKLGVYDKEEHAINVVNNISKCRTKEQKDNDRRRENGMPLEGIILLMPSRRKVG